MEVREKWTSLKTEALLTDDLWHLRRHHASSCVYICCSAHGILEVCLKCVSSSLKQQKALHVKWYLWRVGRGREPWERSEAGGVIGNERDLHHSPVSSPTEELRKG